MTHRITLEVSRDGWTNGLQLNISKIDENGNGTGYRLAGPKFNGSSKSLLERELDERDAAEIRGYLDQGFPLSENETRRAALQEAIHAVVELMFSEPADHPDRSGLQVALKQLHALRNAGAETAV